MECVLIALMYVVVFLGVFILYGVPWLFWNVVLPVAWLLCEVIQLWWHRGQKLVEGIRQGIADCSRMACGWGPEPWATDRVALCGFPDRSREGTVA